MTLSRGEKTAAFFVLLLAAVTVWSYIDALDRMTWWMEAAPVFIVAPVLYFTYKKFPLTPMLYGWIWFHAVVLLVGAHYTYAEMPLFDYFKDLFGFERNHYDRFGHLMQGFVPALAARELLLRTSPLKSGKWMFAIVCLSVLGISALYELIEWAAAALTGEAADAFLGSQGDVWDSQKDMLCALIGAALAQVFLSRRHEKQIGNLK